MNGPSCDVVVASRNRPDRLARCLDGLARQSYTGFRVIVVDDASDVPLSGVVEAGRFDGLSRTAITLPRQVGPAAARNVGAAEGDGTYLVFVDDDVVASRYFVEVHLGAVSKARPADPPIVSFGPFVQPADWIPTPWNLWEARGARREAEAMLAGTYAPTWRQFHTGNNCVPRTIFDALGGFDAGFKRAEDDEFALRLHEAGCRFRFEPAAIAWHYSNRSLEAWLSIPRSYGRYDVEIDRLHPDEGYLAGKKQELEQRHAGLRVVRRLFAGRRSALGVTASLRLALLLYRMGQVELAMAGLSVAYDLSYVDGVREAEASG